MINIIGGKFSKKKIEVPEKNVRPTSALKREAIFSVLESLALKNSYDLYKNKCFIDLFAGSGSFGLEALSRGAKFTYFFEFDNQISKILSKNCNFKNIKDQYTIINKDIVFLDLIKIHLTLSAIFIDPPYKFMFYEKIINIILNSNILEKNSIIVIEASKNKKILIPERLILIKEKFYGKTKLLFIKKLC